MRAPSLREPAVRSDRCIPINIRSVILESIHNMPVVELLRVFPWMSDAPTAFPARSRRTSLKSRITNAKLLLQRLSTRLCHHNVSAAIAGASACSFRSHRPKGLAIYSREQAARTGFQSCFLRPMSVSPYINGIVIVQRNSAFHFGCLLQLHIQFSPGLRPRSRNCASRHSDDTCTSFMQCC